MKRDLAISVAVGIFVFAFWFTAVRGNLIPEEWAWVEEIVLDRTDGLGRVSYAIPAKGTPVGLVVGDAKFLFWREADPLARRLPETTLGLAPGFTRPLWDAWGAFVLTFFILSFFEREGWRGKKGLACWLGIPTGLVVAVDAVYGAAYAAVLPAMMTAGFAFLLYGVGMGSVYGDTDFVSVAGSFLIAFTVGETILHGFSLMGVFLLVALPLTGIAYVGGASLGTAVLWCRALAARRGIAR